MYILSLCLFVSQWGNKANLKQTTLCDVRQNKKNDLPRVSEDNRILWNISDSKSLFTKISRKTASYFQQEAKRKRKRNYLHIIDILLKLLTYEVKKEKIKKKERKIKYEKNGKILIALISLL